MSTSSPKARLDKAHNELLRQIKKALEKRPRAKTLWLDHPANLYLTQYQSDVYLQLMADKDYPRVFHDPVKELFQQNRDSILVGLRPPIDIIDLGPGYPDKTLPLLDLFRARGLAGRYIPVDVSQTFLQTARNAARPYVLPILPLLCLFEQLPARLREQEFASVPSRLVLLGLTFMNYRPGTIISLLSRMVRKSDAVVVAAELADHRDQEELINPYYTEHARDLNLSVMRILRVPDHSVSYFVRMARGRIEMGFELTEDVVLSNGDRLPRGLFIITAISYRYFSKDLEMYLRRRFRSVNIFLDTDGHVAVARCTLSAFD